MITIFVVDTVADKVIRESHQSVNDVLDTTKATEFDIGNITVRFIDQGGGRWLGAVTGPDKAAQIAAHGLLCMLTAHALV